MTNSFWNEFEPYPCQLSPFILAHLVTELTESRAATKEQEQGAAPRTEGGEHWVAGVSIPTTKPLVSDCYYQL